MDDRVHLKVFFGIIAMLALCSNAAFCIVLLRDRRMLKTAYNVLLFSLAVTDMMTGISLFLTPNYVIDPKHFTVPGGVAGDIFCRLIYSQFLVFTLGIVSVYTLTCIAVERWYAVARPHKYKDVFAKNKKHVYVALVWILSCLLNSPHALEMELSTHNTTGPTCIWVTTITDKKTRQAVAVIEFLGKYFLPVSITCATFIHLQIAVRKPGSQFLRRNGNAGLRLLRMCTFTAFVLAICWAPNQIYYLLFKYGVTQLDTPAHHATVVLCMFNSCVNPWIYCATNRTYRKKFASLAGSCCRATSVSCDQSGTSGLNDMSTGTAADKQTISTADQTSCEIQVCDRSEKPAVGKDISIEVSNINAAANLGDRIVLRDLESPSIEETRT